jgi:hypothetical protein
MSPVSNTGPESGHTRALVFLSLATVCMVVVVLVSATLTQGPGRAAHAASGFSFTAAGDYAQTNATTANLKYIAGSGASFALGLGDYSYTPSVTAAAWSAYARGYLGTTLPFEILLGDHDYTQGGAYAADLPNHMANMSGTYAYQYTFDYPTVTPLARFILVSPNVTGYNYTKGSAGYNWVAKTINAARAANIHWVIVGMANYCFDINSQTCRNQDLLDLLLNMHVDLILQAHEHSYQASKQLALNGTTCTTLSTSSYNGSCVANATSNMTRGAGSVITVTGTGGASLLKLNTASPRIGYFRTWMGTNVNPTWGVTRVAVTATQLAVHFAGVSGSFADSFTING